MQVAVDSTSSKGELIKQNTLYLKMLNQNQKWHYPRQIAKEELK
jgi:hypothetical protein